MWRLVAPHFSSGSLKLLDEWKFIDAYFFYLKGLDVEMEGIVNIQTLLLQSGNKKTCPLLTWVVL